VAAALSNASQKEVRMKISCQKLGKRFNRDWIFRNFTYDFFASQSYAITGANGSGKSTLLQVIAGSIASSEGSVEYSRLNGSNKSIIAAEDAFQQLSIAAPYLEVVEEMTATEFFGFHQNFKPFSPGWDTAKIISHVGLEKAANKQIRYYSSGMKQRVKLAQAFFSSTPLLLLDEPCTNLDETGINLYHQMVKDFCKDRIVIVSSNDQQEYSFCNNILRIQDWK